MIDIFRRFILNFKEYIVVISLLLISLSIFPLNEQTGVKNFRSIAFGSFALFSSVVTDIENLFQDEDEVLRLKKMNAELMLEINMLREYGLENYQLKELNEFKRNEKFELIPGTVISRLTTRYDGNLVINAGLNDSVATGMPVVTAKGFLGIVMNVTPSYSLVRTFTNNNLKIAVQDQRSRVNGILSWNGTELEIKNIPTTDDVEVGDRIITSEFSTIVPPTIPIGIISHKETEISGLLSKLVVQAFADIDKVKHLFIVKIIPSKEVDELELNLIK